MVRSNTWAQSFLGNPKMPLPIANKSQLKKNNIFWEHKIQKNKNGLKENIELKGLI